MCPPQKLRPVRKLLFGGIRCVKPVGDLHRVRNPKVCEAGLVGIRQIVIGSIGIGKFGLPSRWREDPWHQHRSQWRNIIVRAVHVPAERTPKRVGPGRALLSVERDLQDAFGALLGHSAQPQRPQRAGKREVLNIIERQVSHNDHAALFKKRSNIRDRFPAQQLRLIDLDFTTDPRSQGISPAECFAAM